MFPDDLNTLHDSSVFRDDLNTLLNSSVFRDDLNTLVIVPCSESILTIYRIVKSILTQYTGRVGLLYLFAFIPILNS